MAQVNGGDIRLGKPDFARTIPGLDDNWSGILLMSRNSPDGMSASSGIDVLSNNPKFKSFGWLLKDFRPTVG